MQFIAIKIQKVLDIVENGSMTFYHHVEEMMMVPYRYMKYFEADYIDSNGFKTKKTYSIYVRDLEKKVKTVTYGI